MFVATGVVLAKGTEEGMDSHDTLRTRHHRTLGPQAVERNTSFFFVAAADAVPTISHRG
jgi:hypothetical protein